MHTKRSLCCSTCVCASSELDGKIKTRRMIDLCVDPRCMPLIQKVFVRFILMCAGAWLRISSTQKTMSHLHEGVQRLDCSILRVWPHLWSSRSSPLCQNKFRNSIVYEIVMFFSFFLFSFWCFFAVSRQSRQKNVKDGSCTRIHTD